MLTVNQAPRNQAPPDNSSNPIHGPTLALRVPLRAGNATRF